MHAIALALTALTSAWIALGTAATLRVTRARPVERAPLPPVTVLKPLCGADPALRENLASFFRQDHPEYELVFGAEREDDPALAIVYELAAAHPEVRARVVVHGGSRGENPKVRNLRGMVAHARHDLVLVSDSNVRAPADYVRDAAATFASEPGIGLVTNLVVGAIASREGEVTLGAALECVELTGFCASGAALPTLVGDAAVIGKSMLFSRAKFAEIGGFDRVADVLAEDYVMGKMFEHAGLRVVIARVVIENVVGPLRVGAFFDRHLRWSMLRARLRPGAFLLEPLVCPLAALPAAWLGLGPWALVWLFAMFAVRDALPAARLARSGLRAPLVLALGPLRDALALAIWAATPFCRHASWRGRTFRVGAGTLLFREA